MAQHPPLLNDAQIKVLRWVKKGCPEGQMHGSSHKATALALQNRNLVKVSKREGMWRCEITPVGEYFLHHRNYPPGSGPTKLARVGGAVRHPALKVLDEERALTDVSSGQKKRAIGLMQDLCCMLTEKGIAIQGNDRSIWHRARAGSVDRGLIQADAGHRPVGIDMREHSNRRPHLPSPKEAALPTSSAYLIPKYDYEPNGKLYFVLTVGSSVNWDETTGRPMEERLADIVQAIKEYSADALRYKQEQQAKDQERRADWEMARERASSLFAEERKAKLLHDQLSAWREMKELDDFIEAMKVRVLEFPSGDERDAGAEWLAWVCDYREKRDPLQTLAMPAEAVPSPADLAPHMGGLSPYGPP